jgi:hypothetical protein
MSHSLSQDSIAGLQARPPRWDEDEMVAARHGRSSTWEAWRILRISGMKTSTPMSRHTYIPYMLEHQMLECWTDGDDTADLLLRIGTAKLRMAALVERLSQTSLRKRGR